jgi:hypothetical protein
MLLSSPIIVARTQHGLYGTAGNSFLHFFNRHRGFPGFEEAAESRGGKLRQKNDTAVWVYKKLDPISWFQPEMLPDELRDRRLALGGDCGLQRELPYNL